VGEHTRWDSADRLLSWFDHELKGDAGASLGASVEVEDSSGNWRRRSASWPPAHGDVLALANDGSLKPEQDAATASKTLAADSRSRYYYLGETPGTQTTADDVPVPGAVDETCATCAVFRMRAAEELRIAGAPEVNATVTPTAASGHVTAFLYRKDAQGLHRLGWGMSDLRFPAGENSGDETAKPVVPGLPADVRIQLEPFEGVVGAGDELVLVLGQGRTGQLPGSAPAPVELHYGGGKSTMSLAFIRPGQDEFFIPPGPEGRQLP